MKVDMAKLMPEESPKKKRPGGHGKVLIGTLSLALCLSFGGYMMVRQAALNRDEASAEAYYDEKSVNPSFTVQQFGDISIPDVNAADGNVMVLGNGEHQAALDENGFAFRTERQKLYEDYETDWNTTDSIAGMSFLGGLESYKLKEVLIGRNADSENESDFLTVETDDASKITFTNNPTAEGVSEAADGRYQADENERYLIPIEDGDVVRLIYSPAEGYAYSDVDMFDYDVSDGGYYREEDYYHRKKQQPTSGQDTEKGKIYVDAIESGIHVPENYLGSGPKFAFGGNGIGTDFTDEALHEGKDALNVKNYTGESSITTDLTKGVARDGNLVWSDGISYLNLFGETDGNGKTCYKDGQYSFTFKQNGFNRTLSAVESDWGTCAEGVEKLSDFWILDGAPSYGTDDHDPIWGDGSEDVLYYKSNDRAAAVFGPSADEENHNHFFGFSYAEDFTLFPGYTGPLGFFGYSDDDMWVYAGQVDDDGQVLTDSVVPILDLGGIHDGLAGYTDLWDVIEKVPYGEEAEHWRIFVFWLEREGTDAKCYFNFDIPEIGTVNEKTTADVAMEALNYTSVKEGKRTFVFDDETGNRYEGLLSSGERIRITSGEEFEIPNDSFVTIKGIRTGGDFTIKETGRAKVLHSVDDAFEEGDTIRGVAGETGEIKFASAEHSGTLTIAVEAENGPEDGYVINVSLEGLKNTEVSAMDENHKPLGSRFTDEDGLLSIQVKPGETVTLYGLPEGSFKLEPGESPGWQVSEIVLDGARADGLSAAGEFPAYVIYRYEKVEEQPPVLTMEQSVTGDWTTNDIVLGKGTLISYKATIFNPNEVPLALSVEDLISKGIAVQEGSITNDGVLDGEMVQWNVIVDGKSALELSFTGEVISDESVEFTNQAKVLRDGEILAESKIVKATLP